MIRKGDDVWNVAVSVHETDFMIREIVIAVGGDPMEFYLGSITLQEIANREAEMAEKYKIF